MVFFRSYELVHSPCLPSLPNWEGDGRWMVQMVNVPYFVGCSCSSCEDGREVRSLPAVSVPVNPGLVPLLACLLACFPSGGVPDVGLRAAAVGNATYRRCGADLSLLRERGGGGGCRAGSRVIPCWMMVLDSSFASAVGSPAARGRLSWSL